VRESRAQLFCEIRLRFETEFVRTWVGYLHTDPLSLVRTQPKLNTNHTVDLKCLYPISWPHYSLMTA
jgi:hypothetical protein